MGMGGAVPQHDPAFGSGGISTDLIELRRRAAQLRHAGRGKEALELLRPAGRPTSELRLEEALAAYSLGRYDEAAQALEGDPLAESAFEPFLRAVSGGEVPRAPRGATSCRKAIHELARAMNAVREGKLRAALGRLRKLKDAPDFFAPSLHAVILEARVDLGWRSIGPIRKLLHEAKDDATLEQSIGRTLGDHPQLGKLVLHIISDLSDRVEQACRRSLNRARKGEAGSPAALLETNPALVPGPERATLHLHRGFAQLQENPRAAERELNAALSRGADQLEVLRGLYLVATDDDPTKERRALERLHRALKRVGVREATLLTIYRQLSQAIDVDRPDELRRALNELESFGERALAIKSIEFVGLIAQMRLAVLTSDFHSLKEKAQTLAERHPHSAVGWMGWTDALEELKAPVEETLSVYQRGRAALSRASAMPGVSASEQLEQLTKQERRYKRLRGVFVPPQRPREWGRSYLAPEGHDGAGCPRAELRDALDGFQPAGRRACMVLEAMRRTIMADAGLEAWLLERLTQDDLCTATAIADAVAEIRAEPLRRACASLPLGRMGQIAERTGLKALSAIVAARSHDLSAQVLRKLKRGRPLTWSAALDAAESELKPDVSLRELSEKRGDYVLQDTVELPEEMEFLRVLGDQRALEVCEKILELQTRDTGASMQYLLEILEEAFDAAETQAIELDLPHPIQDLIDLSSALGPAMGFGVPFGESSEPRRAGGQKNNQKKKKKNRTKGRKKKK